MRPSRAIALLAAASALVFAASVAAKDFRPGDLSVCNAKRCVPVRSQPVLNVFATFYYGRPQPTRAPSPRLGVPYFQLRYRNGYVTGIVATARLDRFLSYGVNLDQFERGRWYRVPASAPLELRKLTAGLKPLRLTPAAVAKTH